MESGLIEGLTTISGQQPPHWLERRGLCHVELVLRRSTLYPLGCSHSTVSGSGPWVVDGCLGSRTSSITTRFQSLYEIGAFNGPLINGAQPLVEIYR
jgi:hypothetical protein